MATATSASARCAPPSKSVPVCYVLTIPPSTDPPNSFHTFQRIYKERKALTASLADMSSAIGKLDGVLLGIALVICIFIFLLIFNKTSTVESLVPVSTFVLGFSFIFSNSAKTLFESLIFIFATHRERPALPCDLIPLLGLTRLRLPSAFDVGDLVLIDSDFLFVKEFGLVSTTFRRWDAQEIIAPNALLATTKLIHNIRRSRAMWEVCSINIAYDTPLEVLEEINVRVKQYLLDNNREWAGGHQVNINSISQMVRHAACLPLSTTADDC